MATTSKHHDGAFFEVGNRGFGTYNEKDELLHPKENRESKSVSTLENQYFGITIPEANIHGLQYLTIHPNLDVVSGGIWVFQGFKTHTLNSEIFNWYNFMSIDALKGDLHDYTLDNGLRVQMLEPGKKFRVSYEDKARENKVDIEYEASMPPVMFESNLHFEQGMKSRGEVVLRGKKYEVNWYTVRDRSWGQPREETSQAVPPITWMSGCFNDDLFFNCTAIDHPEFGFQGTGVTEVAADKTFKAGWIHIDGENIELVDCIKKTIYDPVSLYPKQISLEMKDGNGTTHKMEGEAVAGCRLYSWPNVMVPVCLIRWSYNGKTGYGDAQDAQSSNFIFSNMEV